MNARRLAVAFVAAALLAGAATESRAACATTVFVTNTPSAIQNAVNAIPTPMTGDYCIFLATGVYSEAVVIQKIDPALLYRIVISTYNPTPAVAGRTLIEPPAGSNAAFTVKNATVTLNGMTIFPAGALVTYGIQASSDEITISNVIVNEQGGSAFTSAAVFLSSNTTIQSSSCTANAGAIDIVGSSAKISLSTFTSAAAAATFNFDVGSANNSLTSSYVGNTGAGSAFVFTAPSSNNVVVQSTVAANSAANPAMNILAGSALNLVQQSVVMSPGASALKVSGSGNILTQNILSNNAASVFTAVLAGAGATSNVLSSSTLSNSAGPALILSGGPTANAIGPGFFNAVADVAGDPAMKITAGSNANAFMGMTVAINGNGALTIAANSNVIVNSTFNTTGGTGSIEVISGSSNTIAKSSIFNSLGAGLQLDAGASYNLVIQTTATVTLIGSPALFFSGDSHETVIQSYFNNSSGFAPAVEFIGASSDSIKQSTVTSNVATTCALYLAGGSSNLILQSLVANSVSSGVWIDAGETGATIAQSTISAGTPAVFTQGFAGLTITGAAQTTITQSVLNGGSGRSGGGTIYPSGPGAYVLGGTSNTFTQSILIGGVNATANSPGGDGLTIFGGSSVSLSSSTLIGGAGTSGGAPLGGGSGGNGATINGGNNHSISVSSVTGGQGATGVGGANGGNGGQAVSLTGGASFISVTQSSLFGGGGGFGTPGAGLGGAGGSGWVASGAMWDQVSGSFLFGGGGGTGSGAGGPGGSGAIVSGGPLTNMNTILQSTMTASNGGLGAPPGLDGRGLKIFMSTGTTVSQSYMSDPGASVPGDALEVLNYSTNTFITNSTIAIAGLNQTAAFIDVANSTIAASVVVSPGGIAGKFGPNAIGSGVNASLAMGATGFIITGSTGVFLNNDNIVAFGGGSEALITFLGGVTLVGRSTMTATGAGGIAMMISPNAGPVQATASDFFRGAVVLAGNAFSAGNFIHLLGGDLIVPNPANWAPQTSTVVFDGSNDVPAITFQQITAPAGIGFNGLIVNVSSLQFNGGTGGATTVFTDNLGGSTVTFFNGQTYSITDLEIHGAAPLTGFVYLRSALPGTAWLLNLVTVSSVTRVTVSDSNASPGNRVDANDLKSVDQGGNINWNFLPFLAITLPGQVYTNGMGIVGVPSLQTAGVQFIATVFSVSSSSNIVPAAFPVILNSTDVYGAPSLTSGLTQTLAAGASNYLVTLLTAEPSPHPTQLIAAPTLGLTAFGPATTVVPVAPNAYTQLQIIMPGETANPGSPTGKGPTPPDVQVKAVPIPAVTVREVDQFFNLESLGPVDPVLILGTTASSATWPSAPQATGGGVTTFVSTVTVYSTGTFTVIVASDGAGGIANGLSTPFQTALPTTSSPTASLSVANSYVATLGGGLNGAAADATAVNKVLIGLQDQASGLFLNRWPSAGAFFTSGGVVYGTATLSAQGAQGTGWTIPVPDAILGNQKTYLVSMVPIDASRNSKLFVSSFTFNPGALNPPVSGLGSGTVLPVVSSGCEPVIATVTFTAGLGGIQPGGAIVLRLPQGWSLPLGVSALNPPPPGYFNVSSTSAARGSSLVSVNPATFGTVPLGPGLVLVTGNAVPYNPGEQVLFTYSGLPPLGLAGRGPQLFNILSQSASSGGLAPISPPPLMTLSPGTTNLISFADNTILQMGVLQSATTMQLQMVDVCGNPTSIAVTTSAFVYASNPAAGPAIDTNTAFFALGGSLISSVTFSPGAFLSQPFYYMTSSVGISAEVLVATATFSGYVPGSSFFSSAGRQVQLAVSSLQVTGVSIDTGTPTPGQTSASIIYGIPKQIVTMRFGANFGGIPWQLLISTDPVVFSTPVFQAGGLTNPAHPQSVSWDGLNSLAYPPSYVTPMTYYVHIILAGGVAQDASLKATIPQSPYVYGNLGAGGAGALVQAAGPGAGLGNETVATSTGYFQLFGLVNGLSYNVTAATSVFLLGQNVTISTTAVGVVASNAGTSIPGTLALPATSFLFVSANIATPPPRDVSGSISVHNASYTVKASGNLHFFNGYTSSDNGALEFGQKPATFTVISLPPDLYTVDVAIPALQISTSIVGVSVSPFAITNLPLVLPKKSNVYGYVIVPSTFTGGEDVSISAQRLGSSVPSIFAKGHIPGGGGPVVPDSVTYALYGLDPGSWTITAQGAGFGSTQTIVLVSTGGVDIGDFAYINPGLNLPLNLGGVIFATVTVLGNSLGQPSGGCPAGQMSLGFQAFNATGPTNFVSLCVVENAVTTSGTFTITGVGTGNYLLTEPFQAVFRVLAPGGVVPVTVPQGGVAVTSMTLGLNTTAIVWNIQIPPLAGGVCHSTVDYQSVGITYPFSPGAYDASPNITALTPVVVTPNFNVSFAGGATEQYFCSSMTLTVPTTGSGGPTKFTAFYAPTGAAQVQVVNFQGTTTTLVNFNLSVPTYTVSGKASLSGTVDIEGITGNGAFTVTLSSFPGLISYSTNVSYALLSSTGMITTSALHMELVPLDPLRGSAPLLDVVTSAPGTVFAAQDSFGNPFSVIAYLAAIQTDGSFQFNGVPAGDYVLRIDPVLDGVPQNGQELGNYSQVIHVTGNTTGLSVPIGQGSSISGTVLLPPGMTGSAPVILQLQDGHANAVARIVTAFNNSNGASFRFANVADGVYSVVAQSPNLAARPLEVAVAGASAGGLVIPLQRSGTIKATLGVEQLLPNGTAQFIIITANNQGLLPLGIYMDAKSNPWFQGGFFYADSTNCGVGGCAGAALPAGLALDANGQAVIHGVMPGTYDVEFNVGPSGNITAFSGLVSAVKSGITVAPGQTVDLGLVPILSGATLSGVVTDVTNSTPVPNIPMLARPSALLPGQSTTRGGYPTAVTDGSGRYIFTNLDPTVRFYDVFAAARPPAHPGDAVPAYDMSAALGVDLQSTTTLNFSVTPASYSIAGQIISQNNELLFSGLGQDQGSTPGAAIFLQKAGRVPTLNPVADIVAFTDQLGNFTIPSLTLGKYRMTVTALGYTSSNFVVTITTASLNLGTLQMNWGATLLGTIQKPDGSAPNEDEIATVVGAAPDMSDFFFGGLTRDPITRSVTGYRLSGFQTGKAYRLLFLSSDGQQLVSPPEASNVVFTSSSQIQQMNIVFRPSPPFLVAKDRRVGSSFALTFQLSQPLRKKTANDDNLTTVLTTAVAQGVLSNIALFDNRRTLTAIYTPAVGESSFTLSLQGYTSSVNPDSTDPVNREFLIISTPSFFVGIDGAQKGNVNNMAGGALVVEGDTGRVTLPQGAFGVDASSSVNVLLQKFSANTNTSSEQGTLGLHVGSLGKLAFAPSAYPAHMVQAVAALPATVNPLSAFYDVLLPLGLRTQLSRPVQMTIAYSTAVDPSTLNLYWYNAAANAYILQQDVTGAAPVIDTVNHTITLNVNHFSTFVLFNTNVNVITGSSFAGSDIAAYNFPNPFDLTVKIVNPIHGVGPQTVRGTLISIAVPISVFGDGSIRIYNVAGERIRQIDLGFVQGGSFFYQPWDGRNNAGNDVASGIYIAQVRIGGSSKFFKMALVK